MVFCHSSRTRLRHSLSHSLGTEGCALLDQLGLDCTTPWTLEDAAIQLERHGLRREQFDCTREKWDVVNKSQSTVNAERTMQRASSADIAQLKGRCSCLSPPRLILSREQTEFRLLSHMMDGPRKSCDTAMSTGEAFRRKLVLCVFKRVRSGSSESYTLNLHVKKNKLCKKKSVQALKLGVSQK